MANLDSLGFFSITSSSKNEALELIRQVRERRRVQTKPTKVKTVKLNSKSKRTKSVNNLTADAAAELLKLLTGGK